MYEELDKLPPDMKERALARIQLEGIGLLGLKAEDIVKMFENEDKVENEINRANDAAQEDSDKVNFGELKIIPHISKDELLTDIGPLPSISQTQTSSNGGGWVDKAVPYIVPLLMISPFVLLIGLIIDSIYWHRVGHTEMREEEIVKNVSRVFMHTTGKYTFLVEEVDSNEVIKKTFELDDRKIRIFKDVPKSELMWVKLIYGFCEKCREAERNKENHDFDRRHLDYMEIHIHSEKDIDGGEWSEKQGKRTVTGQTEVVK